MSEQKEKRVIEYRKFQQGDVVMFQVDDETFKQYSNGDNRNINKDSYQIANYHGKTPTHAILAFGEATGHKHQVNMADMMKEAGVTLHMSYNGKAGEDVPSAFEVRNETVTLKHEEHNPIEIPPGKYVVRIVREFDHIAGRARYVAD